MFAEEFEFRRTIRHVLDDLGECAAGSWEQLGHVPREVFAALGKAGVFQDRWQKGAFEGVDRLAALIEETSLVSGGLSVSVMGHSEIFIGALTALARSHPQKMLLELALRGDVVGSFAATEVHGGSDLSAVRTIARREGDGWRLTGTKRYITNLGAATHVLVLCRIDGRPDVRDLSLFVVPLGREGVRRTGVFDTVGLRAGLPGEIEIDAHLPGSAMLGGGGLGLAHVNRLLQFERLCICVQLVTAARFSLGLAAAYARGRQIGETRLIDKQAVRHRLARDHAELWAVESRLRELIAALRAGRLPAHELAGLKLVASRVCEQVAGDSMQVLGARGFTTNYPLERVWRDTRLARIGGGADEVMAEAVASRLDKRDNHFDELVAAYDKGDVPRRIGGVT
ncbi:MAG TPA: acyl-CoA dehydrogenase [Candidatus Limnocylindrales bacterium]|nr:acyl-CoA dehydrogenase [Candidatus Limnocylindrales bacterium]